MKIRGLCPSFVILLFLTLSCNICSSLIGVNAEDGEILQTASAVVPIPENVSINETSDKEINLSTDTKVNSEVLEPSADAGTNFDEKLNENLDNLNTQVFTEIVSQNSGIANEILTNGAPVVLTLSDPATAELQQRAEIPNVASQNEAAPPKNSSQDVLETAPSEENRSEPADKNVEQTETLKDESPKNTTEKKNEEIPSFSEWAQKRIEEAEKEQVNSSVQGQNANGKPGSGAKLRWKNYASLDCGAKVIASNPEAISPWAVLSPSRDEYKLNTCTSRIWFVVELCEAIQAKKINLANYELFSSSPKDFTVSVSDRFPTRDWSSAGHFQAKDERDIQSFDLDPQMFGKYIKVEVKSHYGSEHFCPISLFRVYGINVFEVLQKEDPAHENPPDDDDDDDELDAAKGDSPKNLFSSATDAVISMVKKAAEVLGNKGKNQTDLKNPTLTYTPLINTCTSPSHLVVCNNCSDILFGQIYELLSCKNTQINNLIGIPFIRKVLVNSQTCLPYGFDFRNKSAHQSINTCTDCVNSFFPAKFLGAMCNTVAVLENKVVLNISQQYPNITQNVTTEEKIVNIITSEPHVRKQETLEVQAEENVEVEVIKPTDPLILDKTDNKIASISIDVPTAEIKPTKALTSDVDMEHVNTDSSTMTVQENAVTPSETATQPTAEKAAEAANEPAIEQQAIEVEGIEGIDEHIDHLLNDLTGENNQNSVAAPQSAPAGQPGQKESVFLRLSNRIKALERNVSLSSQYLEELSRRYKKQVEEMHKLLEKTIYTLNEESRIKDERNKQLEESLKQLSAAVEVLVSDRNSWMSTFLWLVFVFAVTFAVFTLCQRSARSAADANETVTVHRRKSIDVVTHSTPIKKRRPSDQALKICRSSSANENDRRYSKEKKRKRKSKVVLKRSNSINTLSEEGKESDWVEGQNQHLEDVPFALDEMEHSTLEDLPVPIPVDLPKIDVPDFVRTATNVRLNRCSSQNSPVIFDNGKVKEITKKSISLDESNNKQLLFALNGNGTGSSAEDTPKKERKGFKKLFKRVF
ncbi:unnamed protein product [Brassicogethes aeneus]|uniref:SUN domain-containing protein n=1 Tax=Brassicogethes aeneus TaxID=1431903 RepID=A0A9P0B747_BRAAE|nr:unnamed protein product [Brassicogethes aeneus]